VILFEDHQGEIYSVRNVSPIVATLCKEGAMLASDLTALCRFTNRYFVVPEYHILKLAKDAIVLKDFNGNQVEPDYLEVDWELNNAGKNGYPFYTAGCDRAYNHKPHHKWNAGLYGRRCAG